MGAIEFPAPQSGRYPPRIFSANSQSPQTISPSTSRSTSSTPRVVITKSPPKFQFPVQVSDDMVMEQRKTREKPRVLYEISSDSEDAGSISARDSSFSSPEKQMKATSGATTVHEDSESEQSEDALPQTIGPRTSAAGHSLRQRGVLQQSRRAQENADRGQVSRTKRGPVSTPKTRAHKKGPVSIQLTDRNQIRQHISNVTARNRANFFIAKKDIFLPLLPKDNFIQKLVEKNNQSNQPNNDRTVPYEMIGKQPAGIKATMKPYQLLGLSFLVYLHRNGVGGLLGDEMGLGKTLQTLALFQYLKENTEVSSSGQSRPFLVVCPLSVLNSWTAEARKWSPDLKVLRFHGPQKERDRLKRIATGELDFKGEVKARQRKKGLQRTAAGQQIIDLESEDELTSDMNRGPDLIVTTYEGFVAEENWFKRAFVWRYVVLDEGHKIKNDANQISQALQGLGAEYRLILTGTPLQNNLLELWALLHWLYPDLFTVKTQELFKRSFNLSQGKVSTKVMDDSRRLLELLMLRRMKNSPGVDLNLPPKTDVLLYCPLAPLQEFWYMRLLTRTDQGLLNDLFLQPGSKEGGTSTKRSSLIKIEQQSHSVEKSPQAAAVWDESKEIMKQAIVREQEDEKKTPAWRKLMNLLMQLRKCCNHPYVLPHAEPDPYVLGEHVVQASGKFIVLDKIIDQLVVKERRKIIIFSGFTAMLNCVEDLLTLRGGTGEAFKYARLDGSTSRARRNLSIRMFNSEKSDYRVILISTRAGGLGINLAAASDVILLDQDFNPQIMLQAEARAHRIGQTKPVTVYKLCTQGTVEEQMLGRIEKKLYLSRKVMESMKSIHHVSSNHEDPTFSAADSDDRMPHLHTDQLMTLVRRGAQALAHPQLNVDEMLSWDFQKMLDRCKDKPADYRVAEQTNISHTKEDEEKWLAQIEHVQSRVFNGKRHDAAKSTAEIAEQWTREERRKGKNTTVMVDGFAVSKESMNCGEWEAIPTLAGKDPRLAEPKREKKPAVVNQSHCQVCWDGGDLICCSLCPRSYHYPCLDADAKKRSKGKMNFSCPQHQCVDCEQKTGDAGGMLYRCRWCERSYCEDCLDWERTELLGETLREYEILGFPGITQAYYVKCPECTEQHKESEEARTFCDDRAKEIDEEYGELIKQQELVAAATEVAASPTAGSDSPGSLTEGPTLDSSGISTPGFAPEKAEIPSSKKRKAVNDLTPSRSSKKLATSDSTFRPDSTAIPP